MIKVYHCNIDIAQRLLSQCLHDMKHGYTV
jgi:hypothetical protein